jgi:phytoene dehydrogenase-like protein
MAQRVTDKITRFAPNFKDIVIRHMTFAPHHMNTMFGAPAGDFCHGLLHPEHPRLQRRASGTRRQGLSASWRPQARRSRARRVATIALVATASAA